MDKRAEPRYALEDEISLAASGALTQLAQVMDVSAHGLRVRYRQGLPPGTPVKIRLDFLDAVHPALTPVFRGQIMHLFAEPGGASWQIGIRLVFPDPETEASFRKILEELVAQL